MEDNKDLNEIYADDKAPAKKDKLIRCITADGSVMAVAADTTNMPPLTQENGLSIYSVLILIYLALVSSVAYTLWGLLLRKNDVSKIAIFGFMTPVLGVILCFLHQTNTG